MTGEWRCCNGCGREVWVDGKSLDKFPQKERYCARCIKPNKGTHISEQKGRRIQVQPDVSYEDDYSEDSLP